MPDLEQRIVVCREWLLKADNDLTNAAHTLKLGTSCPTDTVCFHAQQCVEKYLKAVLVLEGIDFPKTHDLETLLSLVPADSRPDLSDEEQARLTEYATVNPVSRLGRDPARRSASRGSDSAPGP